MISVPKCLSAGIISQIFPLHDPPELEHLQNTWVRDVKAKQPLGKFEKYSGLYLKADLFCESNLIGFACLIAFYYISCKFVYLI